MTTRQIQQPRLTGCGCTADAAFVTIGNLVPDLCIIPERGRQATSIPPGSSPPIGGRGGQLRPLRAGQRHSDRRPWRAQQTGLG